MTTRKYTLDDIFAEDLIKAPALPTAAGSEDSRVRQGFEEINRFVSEHGRPPSETTADGGRVSTTERMLAIRLRRYRDDPELVARLTPFDAWRLLVPDAKPSASKPSAPTSLDEIFDSDDGILSSEADDIFNLRFVGSGKELVDFAAERRKCEDFHLYAPILEACAADIESGRRQTRRFAGEQAIEQGDFFILNGIIVYVAEVKKDEIRYGRKDARLTCIFDNGTESDMLRRSLARQLYDDGNGRRVTNPEAGPLFGEDVTPQDVRRGCVYVAVSLSKDPVIAQMENLYKVGVTSGKPERRVRRAEFDPTFLMAPARLLKTYTIYNADPGKVESILHAFFADVCMAVEVKDRFGKAIKPREWFVVPLEMVDAAVKRMLDGTIGEYRYDMISQAIVRWDGPSA